MNLNQHVLRLAEIYITLEICARNRFEKTVMHPNWNPPLFSWGESGGNNLCLQVNFSASQQQTAGYKSTPHEAPYAHIMYCTQLSSWIILHSKTRIFANFLFNIFITGTEFSISYLHWWVDISRNDTLLFLGQFFAFNVFNFFNIFLNFSFALVGGKKQERHFVVSWAILCILLHSLQRATAQFMWHKENES